jgi:glycosyltransferase involved in cell wall biosynthesis
MENLKKNLPFILEQDNPNFELVIVNDRSNDGTYEFLLELKTQYQNLKIVNIDNVPDHIQSKKYAITLGVRAASNQKLLFTDADCWPNSEKWISEISTSKEFVLGVSLYEPAKGLLNQFIRFETYLTAIQYVGNALLGKPYMGVGRNLGYNKDLFLRNNGFGKFQAIVGGDDDLFVNQHISKANMEVKLGKESLVYSNPKTTWSAFISQKTRHLSVGKYYKFTDKLILGIFKTSFVLFWIVGIGLLFFEPTLALIGFSVRFGLLFVLLYLSSKRFGGRFLPLTLPVLDFLYVIYYISVGLTAAFSKKVKWN